ncbi:enterobactin transporter EntS [Streptomyces sp. NBC_00513]|uniref:enterobactin transporter EntS n=1 Tax=unclassified Streptomyces TaxID=2593676 RepID=UPI0022564C42|nr:enterobactin transporter EntS [Streptomyces sp. NBC_00424]MCX5077231.1 enterobactin transporter EntS [Streptomyces sp. NBC_00424]WUD39781.1 enterobactin transporter EntS [Streptomyces sp. NBC_00513]
MSLRDLVIDIEPLRTSRDFRAIFIARVVSLFGLGMATVALAAQVYGLTRSTFDVAVASMIMSVTVLVGSLWGGVMADRTDRKRLIVWARGAAALAFAGLAVNAMLPDPSLWAIYVCVAWDGLATGVSVTALMAVAPTLVRPDQLPAAGALISLTGEIGSISAPLLGGVLLAAWGAGPVFAFAAVTTAVTTFLISRIRPLPPVTDEEDEEGAEQDSGSPMVAFRYALRNRVVGGLVLLGGVVAVFNVPVVLFPEMVDRQFHGDEIMLGLLYTAPAVGAVLASATSGWIGRAARPGGLLLAAAFTGGLATVGFGLSGHVAVAFLMLAVGGAAGTVYEILEYALVQHSTPDRLRGRIVSVITAQGTTGGVLGDAEVASIARWFSPAGAAILNGAVCAVAAVGVAIAVPGLRRATLPREDDDTPEAPDALTVPDALTKDAAPRPVTEAARPSDA